MLELREVPAADKPDWRWRLAGRASTLRFGQEYDEPAEAADAAMKAVDRSLPDSRIFEVTESGGHVGFVWWGQEPGSALAYDVVLDDPGRAAELLPLLLELTKADGLTRLGLSGLPADRTRTALIGLPGFVARATNMRLSLDRPVAAADPVELRPMTQEEFDAFLDVMVMDYAGELEAAGMSHEAAMEQSRRQTAEFLADGLQSRGQEFFVATVDGIAVGRLWLSTEKSMSFVYDLEVREEHRRKGYGAAIMNAAAAWSREHGHSSIGLNVFAHNPNARALYDKLGYEVTQDFRTIDVPDAG